MSIAVFGASGATGKRFMVEATARGIPLRLHYRSAPDEDSPPLSTVIVGSLADPTAVREVLRGVDATVILFGPRAASSDIFCAKATRMIIECMRKQEQRRLLCMTSATLGAMPGNVSVAMRATAIAWRRLRSEDQLDDRAEQERVVRNSRLDWTLIKPSRLTDDVAGQRYRADTALDIGLRSSIARDTVSQFLLSEIATPRFIAQAVYVTGSRE
ncbi:MAG: NAD(P)H-binding protein [Gemmatimonas sp.]